MRLTLAILLVALPLSLGRVVAADAFCGMTVVADLTLSDNIVCAGAGLVIGADNVTVNLNSHTLAGSGTGIGIDVSGVTGVTIVGGTITNFMTGIRSLNSADLTIKNNQLRQNTDGIDFQAGSRGSTIKDNQFSSNRTRAIMLRADVTQNTIKDNTLTGDRVGILLNGGTYHTVKDNVVTGTTLAAIRIGVTATANVLKGNILTLNPAAIEFLTSADGSGIGNVFIENTITSNLCAVKGPTAGNTFRGNDLQGNNADAC